MKQKEATRTGVTVWFRSLVSDFCAFDVYVAVCRSGLSDTTCRKRAELAPKAPKAPAGDLFIWSGTKWGAADVADLPLTSYH